LNFEEVTEVRKRMKGEPAPTHIYDENGIAAHAINEMARHEPAPWVKARDWYQKLNDEILY